MTISSSSELQMTRTISRWNISTSIHCPRSTCKVISTHKVSKRAAPLLYVYSDIVSVIYHARYVVTKTWFNGPKANLLIWNGAKKWGRVPYQPRPENVNIQQPSLYAVQSWIDMGSRSTFIYILNNTKKQISLFSHNLVVVVVFFLSFG